MIQERERSGKCTEEVQARKCCSRVEIILFCTMDDEKLMFFG